MECSSVTYNIGGLFPCLPASRIGQDLVKELDVKYTPISFLNDSLSLSLLIASLKIFVYCFMPFKIEL